MAVGLPVTAAEAVAVKVSTPPAPTAKTVARMLSFTIADTVPDRVSI